MKALQNKITGPNAGGRRQLAVRTPWTACVAQFHRSTDSFLSPQGTDKGRRRVGNCNHFLINHHWSFIRVWFD